MKSPISLIKEKIRPTMKKIEVDRAVFFGILQRIFEFGTAPLSMIIIALVFTPSIQGYYYTFGSLLALQTFAELGFGLVIGQFASHEWSKLKLDASGAVVGDATALSRLAGLTRFALKWFLGGGIVIVIGLSIGGFFFFSRSHEKDINWILPWFSLCLLTGCTFVLNPVWAILEGCNQVSNVYTIRFYQSFLSKVVLCFSLILGLELWTPAITSLAILILSSTFLYKKYKNFITSLLTAKIKEKIHWWKEVWPMQWRFTIGGLSGYFAYYLFVPVLFNFQGSVVAGKMGMSQNIINLVGTAASLWVGPRVPQFAILIAQKNYVELDRLFRKIFKIVLIISGSSFILLWTLVYALNIFQPALAQRLIEPLPMAMFMISQFLLAMTVPLSSYLRAHKKEPLLLPSFLSGVLITISNVVLGRYYSVMGIAAGYLLTTVIVVPILVYIWFKCKREWHSPTFQNETSGCQAPIIREEA